MNKITTSKIRTLLNKTQAIPESVVYIEICVPAVDLKYLSGL